MRETDLRGKTCVVPVAIAASLGMAGIGLTSSGVVAATDVTSVTDTINVEVLLSCTFNSVTNKSYTGSADNGTAVENFNDGGVHEFSLFCNGSNGYTVTATPHDLEATGIQNVISYTDNYTPSGLNGLWTAEIASDAPAGVTVVPVVPVGGGPIISSDSGTEAAGISFTATYSAYVGTATPAGTYTGTIVYTLTASEASNNSNSGNGGGSGDNSGNEVTDNSGGSGSGDSSNGGGTGGGTTDNSGSGTSSGGSGDASPSSTQSAAPLAMNNTYNTYSTTNTYNTTNYSSGGTGTMGTQVATSGNTNDTTNGTTSGDGDSGSSTEANDDYEQPLGVTTSTSSSSSDKNSGADPMPLIVAGVLAVAGTAGAVALARSNKEEE